MRRLIVNADDFGLTSGINQAVGDLHRCGSLFSATLMPVAPRFQEAVTLAKQHPSLGVGCHIVLVDGKPICKPDSIRSLLPTGDIPHIEFRQKLHTFIGDLCLGRISPVEMEREATAQIRRVQETGLHVTHIDTHKHTHIFPSVLDAVMRAASTCGVHSIRNPFEPVWSIQAASNRNLARRLQLQIAHRFRRNFFQLIREWKFATTDGCLGVLATGALYDDALRSIVSRIPDGTWELVCHPAYLDDELRATRTRLQESRQVELSALQSLPSILAELAGDVTQIQFGQLT